jgi:hypothetical protein
VANGLVFLGGLRAANKPYIVLPMNTPPSRFSPEYSAWFFARGRRLRDLLSRCRATRRESLLDALDWWNMEFQDGLR